MKYKVTIAHRQSRILLKFLLDSIESQQLLRKMDIENMHPFCLPFSLCHDATSSSIIDDIDVVGKSPIKQETDKSSNNEEKRKDTEKIMEDLFDRLDSPMSNHHSLLNDDTFIESSMGDHDEAGFGSLHLDIDMRTDDGFGLHDIEHEDGFCNKDDDWLSIPASHDCSLFSPIDKHLKTRSHLNHQVFQHAFDPIDLKSSPTLAQLNLNSNDDPTDALWDTTISPITRTTASLATSTTSTLISSVAQLHQQHHHQLHNNTDSSNSDLLSYASNCNSTTGTSTSLNPSGFLTSCNHLNSFNHIKNSTTHSASAPYSTHLSNANLTPACQHLLYHNHHHHHHQANITCLEVSPFRKSINQQHPAQRTNLTMPLVHQGCCLGHNHNNQHLATHNANNSNVSHMAQANLVSCNALELNSQAINQQCGDNASAPQHLPLIVQDKNDSQLTKQHQQQRCSSPAPLVTSSSSPHLSVASHIVPNERLGDSRLKENIEYLTVLLCNGNNKLEKMNNPQQSNISSSMAKNYSTLAQTLATGPKLFERFQQSNNPQTIQQHQQPSPSCLGVNNVPNHQILATNEIAPHHCVMQVDTHISNSHEAKRVCQDQWYKTSNVESSVSAADSTAENQPVSSASGPVDRVMHSCPTFHGPNPTLFSATNNTNHQQQQQQQMNSRPSDMKVLSSLLNSNKPASMSFVNNNNQHMSGCAAWASPCSHIKPPAIESHNNEAVENSINNSKDITTESNDDSSIPINGRPITLTPLVSNNVQILQRQPPLQQAASKTKSPTFVQPGSPSTSSTTSSSGNNEIGSSSLTAATSSKKQLRLSSNASNKKNELKQSQRSTRPNSMSTDCSVSSHDEGFSSQIDQDDCANSVRDSDDESDIDSDDESFYGDYTNNDLIGASISDIPECKWTLNMGRTRRNGQKRFFWQYNVQSKGPKGTRICSTDGAENPFVLPEASDPVFSNECQVEGVKHSGKARRGDGNDLTPNPRKLLMIGLELKKLSKIINELAPVTDLPINARNKTRKEKNKLASRACRLKKKAQHEANKIKLFGLQREHQQVVMAIFEARKTIHQTLTQQQSSSDTSLSATVKDLHDQCSMNVAGQSSDYVNSVLEKVVSGCIDGGLQA